MADTKLLLTLCVLVRTFLPSDCVPVCCNIRELTGESHVICSGCRLLVAPHDIPTDATALDLSNNNITVLKRDSFPTLPLLKTLYLRGNHITQILSGVFEDLPNIEELDLSDNKLDHISFDLDIFEPLKKLTNLKLHKNNFHLIKAYPETAFSTLSNLKFLSIDIFEGFHFGDSFSSFEMLQILELSSSITDSIYLVNTSFIGFRRSYITQLSIQGNIRHIDKNFLSPFNALGTLKMHALRVRMDIHNALRGLYSLRGREINEIYMNGFRERFTKGYDLTKTDMTYLGSVCVKKLSIINSGLSIISTNTMTAWTAKKCIKILDVSWNMFHSPQMVPLIVLFSSLTHLTCTNTQGRTRRNRSISFRREQTIFLPEDLRYINFAFGRISGSLNNIRVQINNKLEVLNISYSTGHPACSLIKGLPHLKVLDMSGVICSTPHPRTFSVLPNLSRLVARKCDLGKVFASNSSLFRGLYNLSFLDISSNDINSFNIDLLNDQMNSLKTLVLDGNILSGIPYNLLRKFIKLQKLDMSNNLLSTLNHSDYSFMEKLKSKSNNFKISLFGNPFVCNCEQLDFLSWLRSTDVIYKKDELMCSTSEGNQMKIVEFLESFDQFKDHCVSQTWLIISVIVSAIFFVLGILTKEAWRRSVWLRVMCRLPAENTTYTNDIYTSYCYKDSSWVAKTLIPWLDVNDIKYCFDDKSFQPGRDIADNIMDAIDSSRQTIFVVSYEFLQQEWTTFTLRLTNEYSFRDGRENMNIIVLLNDIKRSEFSKLVRKNWNVIRPIRWPDESNTSPGKRDIERDKFWGKISKRIQRQI